jgi:hypothetical protein
MSTIWWLPFTSYLCSGKFSWVIDGCRVVVPILVSALRVQESVPSLRLGQLLRSIQLLHQEVRRLLTTQVWSTAPGIGYSGRIGHIHGHPFLALSVPHHVYF